MKTRKWKPWQFLPRPSFFQMSYHYNISSRKKKKKNSKTRKWSCLRTIARGGLSLTFEITVLTWQIVVTIYIDFSFFLKSFPSFQSAQNRSRYRFDRHNRTCLFFFLFLSLDFPFWKESIYFVFLSDIILFRIDSTIFLLQWFCSRLRCV